MTDFARFFCVDSTCWLNCGNADPYTVPVSPEGNRGSKRSIDAVCVSAEEDDKPTPTEVNSQKGADWNILQSKTKPLYVVQKNGHKQSVRVSQAQDFDSYFSSSYGDLLSEDDGKRERHVQRDEPPTDQTRSTPPTTTGQNACYIIHDEESISSIFRSNVTQKAPTHHHTAKEPELVLPAAEDCPHQIVQRC